MRTAFGDDWQNDTLFAAVGMPLPIPVAYGDSDLPEAKSFLDWKKFATTPYVSATHGGRFVVNYANDIGEEPYGRYEAIGTMPPGGITAKPSFTISQDGVAALGPLFLMEKMEAGWYPQSGDWRYTMVMPDGTVFGRTLGQNSDAVAFCIDCHAAVGDTQDHLFLLPEEVRVR